MIWGMTESTFTTVHVVLSLIGIGSGLVVMFGLLGGKDRHGWTVLFLATTVATSVTGFGFPLRSPAAGPQGRHHLAGGAGGGAPRILRISPGRPVALDLRGLRRDRPLPQRLRRGRAGLPEGACADRARAQSDRGAVRNHPARRAGAVHRAD